MVVDRSYEYPRAELIGAGTLALATGLLISWLFGKESIWWFLPAYIVSYLVYYFTISRFPSLKRKLIHPDELTTEVKEKAVVSFVEQGLHETRDRTGILILISLLSIGFKFWPTAASTPRSLRTPGMKLSPSSLMV